MDALCLIVFNISGLFYISHFFCECSSCRSATASLCPMALIREDQPAARDPVTHPVLMEVEAVVGMEVQEAPSLTLSAHLSWRIPNNRGLTREATQLQLTCSETTCHALLRHTPLAPSARPPAPRTWPATVTAALRAAVRSWLLAWCSCRSRPSSRTARLWCTSPCRRLANR